MKMPKFSSLKFQETNPFSYRIHGDGFYAGLEGGAFKQKFDFINWLRLVDRRRFAAEASEMRQ